MISHKYYKKYYRSCRNHYRSCRFYWRNN